MAADRNSVSIYLLKTTQVGDFRSELLEGSDAALPLAGPLEGVLLPLPSPPREPGWVASVRQLIQNPAALSVTAQSAGGLMIIARKGRTFVVCFGHGWMRLKPEWLEHDFGRRVALNAISRDRLLEINAEQVFAKWHLARERAPRATSLQEFGIESERDLVSAVEGVPTDETLGPVLRGGTSVRLKVPLTSLPDVLDKLDTLYRSKAHHKQWPELHNLIPIVDPDVTRKLDARLDADLVAGTGAAKVILFAPTLRREDHDVAESYVFGRNTKSTPTAPYLLFGSWESCLARAGRLPSVQSARETPVHLLDDAREEVATCCVYDCFGYETNLGSRQYVLSSGVWYEAGRQFVSTIDGRMKSLQGPSFVLPAWDGSISEGEYNRKCASNYKALLHFDARNVMFGGGQSKFELCDLMHPAKRIMYFVKIPNRSADFSHLSEQARRTVELVFNPDGAFRSALKSKMKTTHPTVDTRWLDHRPKPGEWNLCLVSLGREAVDLPFFAKCGLARLMRDLEERGHPVSYLAV